MSLGDRIAVARKAKGMSQTTLLYFYAHLVDSDMTENRQKDKRIKPYEL